MLSFTPHTAIAQIASTAAGCAILLTTSNVALRADAATGTPALHQLAQLTTAHGETLTFALLTDGSVGIDGIMPVAREHESIVAGRQFASPLELFRAAAPNVAAPAELIAADARYTAALRTVAPGEIVSPAFEAAQGPRLPDLSATPQYSQQWFVNDFCKPADHSSFHVCDTNAYSWAYLKSSSVYYGHAAAAALNHSLLFTVKPVGKWTVPSGYYRWASEYHYSPGGWNNFAFYAAVTYARSFDFEADVDY